MELRSRQAKIVVASLFFGALLLLSGCGVVGHHTGITSTRVSFGQHCPSCGLTRATGCRCSPDGWSCGQTVWRPLTSECSEWVETTTPIETTSTPLLETTEPTDSLPPDGRYSAEPELAPLEEIPTPPKTTLHRSSQDRRQAKWGTFWLGPKPIPPLLAPSEMVSPTPERMDQIASLGI